MSGSRAGQLLAGYLAAINLGSAAIFYYDKESARHGQWRVSEATLCTTALLGGWVGGL